MEQRERIGIRVEAILSQFWRDDSTPQAVQLLEIESWMDVLEPLTEDEIRRSWVEYQRSGPRTARGALRRPDPGALYVIAMGWRTEVQARERFNKQQADRMAEQREADRRALDRISGDRAIQIVRELAASKTMGKSH